MKKPQKDMITLLLELEKVNKELEEIRKPDSEYIRKKVIEIYGRKEETKK